MSDRDELFREMLERITKKVESSPALNGGFDKLMVTVEHIKEKQDSTWLKVDKIHEGLYEPDTGLYARVRSVETSTATMAENYEEHIINDEKSMDEINSSLKKIGEISERADEVAKKVKSIAGEELEKLTPIIKARTLFGEITSKAIWLLGGGILAAIGKTVWEIVSK